MDSTNPFKIARKQYGFPWSVKLRREKQPQKTLHIVTLHCSASLKPDSVISSGYSLQPYLGGEGKHLLFFW